MKERTPWRVWALAALFAAVYAAYSLQQHHLVRTNAYDLGIFDQAMRGYAHFHAPYVPLKGSAHYNLLGDHFHPILVLLTPLYWIWDDPRTLLVAQAALIAASIPAVWRVARRTLGDTRAPYAVAIAYGLAWGIQTMVAFDFHELAFAVPLVAWAIERVRAERWLAATLCVLALLLVKEDLTLLVSAFGLYVALLGRRKLGLGLVVTGVVGYVAVTRAFMPFFSGGVPYSYWNYGRLGPDLPHALLFMLRHPLRTVRIALTPSSKQRMLLWLFAPTTFLALGSPVLVLSVPLLAERLLSDNPHHWGTTYHYSATLMPIVVVAAIDTLARLTARRSDRVRLTRRVTAAWALAAAIATSHFPFHSMWDTGFWHDSTRTRNLRAAVALVPDGVRVAAASVAVPQLTKRTETFLFEPTDHGATWVVADVARVGYPFKSIKEARSLLRLLITSGWRVVYNEFGIVVLTRP